MQRSLVGSEMCIRDRASVKKIDFSTRGARPTRPGERPPARWTARTVPRFSSMTPPSMHSSSLRILCICGGCTSECQKGATSAHEAHDPHGHRRQPQAHQERLPEKQKEAKRSKSARFKNAKEAKVLALRNRLRKSGRRACKKCSTQRTRTHRKYCHTELKVPRTSGPPEY